MEENERDRITSIKESEKSKVNQEIEFFKEAAKVEDPLFTEIVEKKKISENKNSKSIEKLIFNDMIENSQKFSYDEQFIAPRSNGIINFKFTPRVFPTPSRESQDKQEKDVNYFISFTWYCIWYNSITYFKWLQNQSEARKLGKNTRKFKLYNFFIINYIISIKLYFFFIASLPEELKDLSENETNLDWLKEKAR